MEHLKLYRMDQKSYRYILKLNHLKILAYQYWENIVHRKEEHQGVTPLVFQQGLNGHQSLIAYHSKLVQQRLLWDWFSRFLPILARYNYKESWLMSTKLRVPLFSSSTMYAEDLHITYVSFLMVVSLMSLSPKTLISSWCIFSWISGRIIR